MGTKETVENAYMMTENDLEWRELYANNMLQSELDGYYCIIRDEEGFPCRKYTITFQYELDERGFTREEWGIDRYILFEKSYSEKVRLNIPEPSREPSNGKDDNAYEVNDYGRFVYAYKTLEDAKKRALRQYVAIYGYAMSHLLSDEELEEVSKKIHGDDE